MATFTRDWDEDTVADTSQASTLGQVDRNNQVDLSDRLKALIYGFVAGENDGVPGCKYLHFKQQDSDPTVATDTITIYAKDVGGNNELYTKDEAGNVVQLTTAGAVGAGGLTLLAGKDLIGSATSDITFNTNKFTVAGATGNTVIAGTLGVTGVATVGKGSLLASSDAPTSDAMIANKKYVDDEAAKKADVDSIFGDSTGADSESDDFAKAHAYSAPTDGIVTAWTTIGNGINIKGYVGDTDDPAGAGTQEAQCTNYQGEGNFISFPVPKDKYWEVTSNGTVDAIRWRAIGTLSAPVDQD